MLIHNSKNFTKPNHFGSTKPLLLGAFLILGLAFAIMSGDILKDGLRISHYGQAYKTKIEISSNEGIRDLAYLVADEIVRASKKYDGLKSIELLVFLNSKDFTDRYGQRVTGSRRMGTIYTGDIENAKQYEDGSDYYNANTEWFLQQITKLNYLKYLG